MSLIAERIKSITPSPTLAINQKAADLKRSGVDLISLSAGEPDFDTPENIKNAAIAGIKNGDTKYTNVDGTQELKAAIIRKFETENKVRYEKDEITVGAGGKQVIYNLFMATVEHGDEVIIPAPYWVSYPDMVLLAGGTPVYIKCPIEQNFKLKACQLDQAINEKTKWVIINSPSNPSGACYSKSELLAIADVIRKHKHVNVISDDIYEHITFDDFEFHTLASIAHDIKDRIFTVNGVSKSYSMTGWRIGYGAGHKDIVKAMSIIQSHSTSNPSSISQIAALEALSGTQSFIKPNALEFQKKRDLAIDILSSSHGLTCYKPEGAFYLFVSCDKLIGAKTKNGVVIKSSSDLVSYLLEFASVAVVPGEAFGLDGYFRISYATTIQNIEKACTDIRDACALLIKP